MCETCTIIGLLRALLTGDPLSASVTLPPPQVSLYRTIDSFVVFGTIP